MVQRGCHINMLANVLMSYINYAICTTPALRLILNATNLGAVSPAQKES